jgi:amino acid adenylation domain-containing protein
VSSLVADAASLSLLVSEIVGAGAPVEDPLQYADFSAWQRDLLESGGEDEAGVAADFWSAVAEATGPAIHTPGGGSRGEAALELDRELVDGLQAQATRYGASSIALVQAAWHALLGRFSGEDEVTVALLSGERRHADLEGAIGAFARPVPVTTRVDASLTFAELLHSVAQARAGALVYQDYAPIDGPAATAVGFISCELPGDTKLERLRVSGLALRVWLTCVAGQDRLALSIEGVGAERLAGALKQMLEALSTDLGTTIAAVDLLDETEKRRILEDFNDTVAPVDAELVHERIARHAQTSPGRAAVTDEHGSITYSELDARANHLAHRLTHAGVGPEVGVGLCTERSVDMVVGLLAILKAGGAYVPLHYEHPPARLGHQLSTANAKAILTQQGLLARLPDFAGEVICIEHEQGAAAEPPEVEVSPEHLAYVIYTSGSTGTPKGVGVTHANLVNYATHIARELGADREPQSFGLVTSISTDLGNTSLFGALCSGGTLVLISPATASDPGAFANASPVDVIKITPSHLGALLAGGDGRVLPRRTLVLGGERAPWDLVERVRSLSQCEIVNHYGPTETTVGSCTFRVSRETADRPASVPIGRPIANTACYVLDEQDRPVPVGVKGRLFIAGAGVARGYVGEPELTAERFRDDPFSSGRRMYDTGDLARWLPDGTLEFLGRADEQLKIRGYRVEPAEVEAALRTHETVREAVVVAQPSAAGDAQLIAYCVTDQLSRDDLRKHVSGWLPEFMLPSAIVLLDSLPRTPSGKVDRLALPDPDGAGEDHPEYLAPRTPMEDAVAAIWSRVLGVEKIGVEDDFFALGGHSLLATQVVAQIRSDFAVDLPLHSLFTYPTVASLTAEIIRMMGESEEDETAKLLAELESLSDEDAERLLAADEPGQPR